MNLNDIEIIHNKFGLGRVTQFDGKYITVHFEKDADKIFIYPDAFNEYIKAKNTEIQEQIEIEIELSKNNSESLNKTKLESSITNRIELVSKNIVEEKSMNSCINTKTNNKNYFFVFQNKTYSTERRGGFLWAPKCDRNGRKVSHWLMMKQVNEGDVIFHSYNKKIVAISFALSDCYLSTQPHELKENQLWENEGYKIDCKYIDINNPIITSDYSEKIVELQPKKYAPFNSLEKGNTGYLFLSNEKLSAFLFERLLEANAYLSNYRDELGF